MVTPEQLPFNSTVSFEVYPFQILGDGFNNAKVLAIVDAETAQYWIDPVSMHAAVFPTLPQGTVNKHDGYMYVKLRLSNGQTTAIGLPWIRSESLRIINTRKLQLTIDNVTAEDEPRVLRALSANGFTAVDVRHID